MPPASASCPGVRSSRWSVRIVLGKCIVSTPETALIVSGDGLASMTRISGLVRTPSLAAVPKRTAVAADGRQRRAVLQLDALELKAPDGEGALEVWQGRAAQGEVPASW